MRLLLVGQAPSKRGSSDCPLEGAIGRKIASLARISFEKYLEKTDRMNVFSCWPGKGKSGKGDAFCVREAKQHAAEKVHLLRNRCVIFVGKATAAAFCLQAEFLKWEVSREFACCFAVVPHLSGIVRWWNEPGNRLRAGRFLCSALRGKCVDA